MKTTVTKRQIEILEHMLGDESHYRNHYATFEDSKDYDVLCEMERGGLIKRGKADSSMFGDMLFFYATGAGKRRAFKGFHKNSVEQ